MDNLEFNRRRFIGYFSSVGLGATLMPGTLTAVAQDAAKVSPEMVEAAAKLAGLSFQPDAIKKIVDSLNGRMSLLTTYERIRKMNLGNDVPPEKFVETAVANGATVIGMSALLTTTMTVMKKVVDLLDEKGLKGRIKTIVGGAPLSADYAREIGADAYGYDGANAVEEVKKLIAAA